MKINDVVSILTNADAYTGNELRTLFKEGKEIVNIPHLGEGVKVRNKIVTGSFIFLTEGTYLSVSYGDISDEGEHLNTFDFRRMEKKGDLLKVEKAIEKTKEKINFLEKMMAGSFESERNFMHLPQFNGFMKRQKIKGAKELERYNSFFTYESIRYAEKGTGNVYVRLKDAVVSIPFEEIETTQNMEQISDKREIFSKPHHLKEAEMAKTLYEKNIAILEKIKKDIRIKTIFS